jgi:hypothetical protein
MGRRERADIFGINGGCGGNLMVEGGSGEETFSMPGHLTIEGRFGLS